MKKAGESGQCQTRPSALKKIEECNAHRAGLAEDVQKPHDWVYTKGDSPRIVQLEEDSKESDENPGLGLAKFIRPMSPSQFSAWSL